MVGKLDHSRVITIVRRANHLPLIQKYLSHVQTENHNDINEALNELYIQVIFFFYYYCNCYYFRVQEENYKALRTSITDYVKFDQTAMAQRLEKHQLLEFRRIASHLYKVYYQNSFVR